MLLSMKHPYYLPNLVQKQKWMILKILNRWSPQLAMLMINLFSLRFSSIGLMMIAGAVSLIVCGFTSRKQKGGGAG